MELFSPEGNAPQFCLQLAKQCKWNQNRAAKWTTNGSDLTFATGGWIIVQPSTKTMPLILSSIWFKEPTFSMHNAFISHMSICMNTMNGISNREINQQLRSEEWSINVCIMWSICTVLLHYFVAFWHSCKHRADVSSHNLLSCRNNSLMSKYILIAMKRHF